MTGGNASANVMDAMGGAITRMTDDVIADTTTTGEERGVTRIGHDDETMSTSESVGARGAIDDAMRTDTTGTGRGQELRSSARGTAALLPRGNDLFLVPHLDATEIDRR